MAVDLPVEASGSLALDVVELLAPGLLDAELEQLEHSSAPLELIDREAGLADEGIQACGYSSAGCRLGDLGMCGTATDERRSGDAVALEGRATAVGVGDDPLAQSQPIPPAVPGRDLCGRARGDGQGQSAARAGGLGLQQRGDRCFSGFVPRFSGFDLGDRSHRGGDDCLPLPISEGLRVGGRDLADLGRHAEGR